MGGEEMTSKIIFGEMVDYFRQLVNQLVEEVSVKKEILSIKWVFD